MLTDAPIYIIAEAGVNHNGDLGLAKKLVEAGADAGADAVKFQTFRAQDLVSRSAPKADYQARITDPGESQFEMIRRLELGEDEHQDLLAHARSLGIAFLSSPFDLTSLRLLTDRLGLETIKLGSGEVTNGPLLLETARRARQVILSTGMSTLEEIRAALEVLALGFTDSVSSAPTPRDLERAFDSDQGQRALRERVTLLHCTSEYPAPFDEVNLAGMTTMADEFGLPVGYSDHTTGIHVSLAAVARGARIIEKHLTIDRDLPGPDHGASLEPREFRDLVRQAREVARAVGDGRKVPSASEAKNIPVVRRSLVASRTIRAGEAFSEDNIMCKRPGTGISPMMYWETLGKVAERDYETDEALDG